MDLAAGTAATDPRPGRSSVSIRASLQAGARRRVAASSLVFAVLAAGCGATAPGPAPTSEAGAAETVDPSPDAGTGAAAVVTHLVDGDTVDVRLAGGGEERVRLIGIDTPETKKPGSPIECFGPEASAHLAELVPVGTAVRVLRDVEARDVYGRFLAYLFRAADDRFVNLVMAEDGYADALSIPPNTAFSGDVARAVAAAKQARRGLWGACPTS